MKKLMLKKVGTWFILLVFIFTTILSTVGLPIVANAATDFYLTHNISSASSGVSFPMTFTMKALKAGTTISDVVLDFSVCDILRPSDNNARQNISGTFDSVSGGSFTLNVIATGDGTSSLMNIKVEYTITGDGPVDDRIATETLYLNIAKAPEPSNDDLSQYKPSITASVADTLILSAGTKGNVTLFLNNTSSTIFAKDITFSQVIESGSPFISAKPVTSAPISQLGINSSAQLTLSVEVDKFAQEGPQAFTFDLKYKNPWNYEKTERFTVYIKVENSITNCSLHLSIPDSTSFAPSAGGTFELPLLLKNVGTLSAKGVKISLKGLSQDTFTLVSGTGKEEYNRIDGNESKMLSFNLRASSSLKGGSYPLSFSLTYTDEKGTTISEEQEVWIPVTGSGATGSILEVLEITPSRTTVKPEEIFDVTVKIKNSGASDSGQVKISADGTALLLPVSQNLHIVQSIKKGETKTINFKFQPQSEAPRGGVPIVITVEPVGGEGAAISQAISVFVDSDKTDDTDTGKNVPKIIIKSYSSDPTLVKAGETFNLSMEFLNTHGSKTVRNVKGSFSVSESSSETGNVFTPVGSSNTFYIDKISPQGSSNWDVTLYTIPDAKSKTYTINIAFEYEDEQGTAYTANEQIGIPVYQPSRFEVSEFSLPSDTFMGQPVYMGFEMYNLGKTEIYNVKLKVEGDFEAQPKSNYFGNFESGRVEYFELNLMPMMVGQANGRIIFEYENSSGEKQEVIKEISMNVMEMMMPDDGFPVDGPGKPMDPGMEEQPAKSFFTSIWFYIILGVVVVLVIVIIIVVVRKRKKSKEFDF